MNNGKFNIARITIFGVILLILIAGCSSGSNSTNPVTPQSSLENAGPGHSAELPVIAFDSESAIGVMGSYSLTISPDSLTAELAPLRTAAIGESFIVSGKSFFNTFPCRDCLRISELGYENGRIIVKFSIRHPFAKGNTQKPPSGKNRLDLDLFDPALIVMPEPVSLKHYSKMNMSIPSYAIDNPDGFSGELSYALPYVLIQDDSEKDPPSSTFNKFEMGTSKEFEVKFPVTSGQTLAFDLFLTFGYGVSAIAPDRLNPKYYNPEFNRKAAWKVVVTPPNEDNPPVMGNTWDDTDHITEYDVTVKVYDWQINANVNPNLTNTTDVYAASNIDHICVEIPEMNSSLKQVDGGSYLPGGTGMPNSPLVYKIPIANEDHLPAGEYVGLVGVFDEREPKDISEGRDYLIDSPNGVILNRSPIAGFRTYQTFIATVVKGGSLTWLKRAGGAGWDEGLGITTLSDNSTVVTGFFGHETGGTATFGEGEPNQTILTSAGLADIFIARYNPDGTLAWAKSAGGSTEWEEGLAITALSDDSTVVTGFFRGEATFGPGEPNQTILTSTATGSSEFFVARYNPNGKLEWAKCTEGPGWAQGYGITTLSDNSTVVTGMFSYSVTFGPGELNQTILTPGNFFIARYNPDGTLEWAKCFSETGAGSNNDDSMGITTLSDDSTVVTSNFWSSITFGQGEPNQTVLTTTLSDIFIARYNPDGTLAWAKQAGDDAGYDQGHAITSLSDDSIAVTGASAGGGIFIGRYYSDGSQAWVKNIHPHGHGEGYAITTLSDNSIVVTGDFNVGVRFGEGELHETYLSGWSYEDIFIARFNPDGTLVWATWAGGPNYDYSRGITALSNDSTVVTGNFLGTTTFGLYEPNETKFPYTAGHEGSEIFVARFEP